MKYIATFILSTAFIVCMVSTALYQGKQGYASGVQLGKLHAQGDYLTAKKKFIDSFSNAHKFDRELFDSLKYEVLKQGQEAKEINRKLVKRFKL